MSQYTPRNSFFNTLVQHQQGSTDVVIYSPELKSAVTIALYVILISRVLPCVLTEYLCSPIGAHGQPIMASGIREYNRRHEIVWGCFCPLKNNPSEVLSTRIVDAVESGDTHAFCHHQPSRCGFSSKHMHPFLAVSLAHFQAIYS